MKLLGSTLLLLALCAGTVQAQRAGGAAAATLTLQRPAVRIGVADGDSAYLLFGARSAALLSNGSIAVANTGSNQIHVYDARGRHVRTLGRAGNGPGEFRGLQKMGSMAGDTIVAYDVFLGRITYFAPDGRLARTLQVQPFSNSVLPRAVGFTGDGRMLAHTDFDRIFSPGRHRDTVVFALFDRRGAPKDTLGRYAGSEYFIVATPAAAMRRDIAFGRDVHASARGSGAVVGSSDAMQFDVYGANARRVRRHSAAWEPRRVTPREVERANAEWLENLHERVRGDMTRMIKQFPAAPTYPAFADLRHGQDGTVWVQAPPAPGSSQRSWTVFGADGRKLRDVTSPLPMELLDVGAGYAVGWMRDELDVEQILVFRF